MNTLPQEHEHLAAKFTLRCKHSPSFDLFRQPVCLALNRHKKIAHDRMLLLSRTSVIFFTRGATLLHGMTRALCGIPLYSRQLTYASTSRNTRLLFCAFPRALHGPFGNLLFDPAPTFPDSLCAHDYFDLRIDGLSFQLVYYATTEQRLCQPPACVKKRWK